MTSPTYVFNRSDYDDPSMTSTNVTSVPIPSFDTRDPCKLVLDAAIALVLVALILFAIAGNILVIVAVFVDANLRRTNNYFVVSLACADTLVAVAVMSFALVNDILGRWIFGGVVCRVWMSADVMCSTASILSLCSVSLDRWVHVRRPLHYERSMTSRRALAAVLSVWVLSALISFVPIHLDLHRQRTSSTTTPRYEVDDVISVTMMTPPEVTSEDCTMALNPSYAIVSSLVSFYVPCIVMVIIYVPCIVMVIIYVPCIVMVIIYVKLYRYAKFHADNIRRITAIAGVCAMTSSHVVGSGDLIGNRRVLTSEHKAAVTLGIIVGVFLTCWMPFFTVNVIGAVFPSSIDPVVFTVFSWLGYLNSTMNPVIYCVFNRDFRIAFKRILLSVPPPRTFSFRTFANRRGLIYSASAATMETEGSGLDTSVTARSSSDAVVLPIFSGLALDSSIRELSVLSHVTQIG